MYANITLRPTSDLWLVKSLRLREKVASDLSSGSLYPFLLGPAPPAVCVCRVLMVGPLFGRGAVN